MAKSEGSVVGKLIIIVILLVIGIILGLSPVGWQVKKVYYAIRYYKTPVAQDYLSKPFALNIHYVQNDAGELETYLVNGQNNEMLPVYEVDGTIQVGNAEHRMKGIGEETRQKLLEIFEETKDGGVTALDKFKQALESLGD